MRQSTLQALAIALLLVGCDTGGKPEETGTDPGVDPNLRIGHVMIEVGYRFETAGRAAEAEAFDLAAYEVHEISEIFETDMTRSLLPGVCDDTVSEAMYDNLMTQLPVLRTAAAEQDITAFRAQFETISGSCNGCHAGCQAPFIRVPTAPGVAIPMMGDTTARSDAALHDTAPGDDTAPGEE